VSVHPDVTDDELATFYAVADVVAAPSNNERACLGLAIAEAMSAGLPVVACAVGGTGEVVLDGRTGILVPPNDHSALSTSLLRYLADPALRAIHGQAGRTRAAALFDVVHTNEQCERLFRDVAFGRGLTPP
jgi:glycosyltransferase involved in cell wall biosynthesis